jgi:hypothetical protein
MFKFSLFLVIAAAAVMSCTTAQQEISNRSPAQSNQAPILPPDCKDPKQPATSSMDEAVPRIDEILKCKYGINADYKSRQDFTDVQRAIEKELAAHQGDGQKDQENFLKEAQDLCEDALKTNSERDLEGAFIFGKRILHGILVMNLEEEKKISEGDTQPTRVANRFLALFEKLDSDKTKKAVIRAERFLLKDYVSTVPKARPSDTLDEAEAELEAKYLVDKNGLALDRKNLVGKTHLFVAQQDISPGHPAWNTKAHMDKYESKLEAWTALEKIVEAGVTKQIKDDKKVPAALKAALGTGYQINKNRRVLFFEDVKTAATSPKVKSKDAFGQTWSLKWGDEVQTEPVTSRLWVALGGKFNDLVYANGWGASEVVLILPENTKSKTECAVPVTDVPTLKTCLLKSKFQFNLDPYVETFGTITAANAKDVLTNLPASLVSSYIGRSFVTFKESSQEFHPDKDVIRRGGPAPFGSLGSLDDRVARGLIVFNFWINNTDAKDDNNLQYIVKKEGQDYFEAQHDLGASLGGVISLGQVNALKTGEEFISDKKDSLITKLANFLGHKPQNIYFRDSVLYHPQAWNNATWADAAWMAEKIVRLPNRDLAEIIKASHWPLFVQKALYYKLHNRRAELAKYFGPHSVDAPTTFPAITVNLSNKAAIKNSLKTAAGEAYATDSEVAAFEDFMKSEGVTGPSTELVVDQRGQVNICEQSLLVNFLQRRAHPAGLSRRVSRLFDGMPVAHRGCTPGAPPQPSDFQILINGLGQKIQAKFKQ